VETDKDLLLAVIKFLLQHGYPEESLVVEWPIGQRYRADLAVVDPDTNKAIALFEFKRVKNPESMKMALRQLEAYAKAIGDIQVPTYAVFGKEGEESFEIYHIEKGVGEKETLSPVALRRIPDFSIFKNSNIRKSIEQAETKKERVVDDFRLVCWVLAIIVIALLVGDFKGLIKITPERLSLIFLIAILFVIPFASKLKFLGLEYERLKKQAGN